MMKYIKVVLLIGLFTFTLSPFTLKAQSSADLEKLIVDTRRSADMKHGSMAVCVYNITQGKQLYAYNAEQSMIPGSVNKIFTTGVGFVRLGSDFRFVTKIGIRGEIDREGVLHGNIFITGGGDPLLGSYRYRQTTPDSLFNGWTSALKKKGVKRVDGRVCFNTSIFDEEPLHDSWEWGDIGNYYGAGVSGLNFHENMYFVYFNPGKKIGYPASAVRIQPKNLDIHGTCEVTTAGANTGDQVTIYGSPFNGDRLYRGTVPLGKNDFAVRGAMPNPARSCADMFASFLRTHGVGVSSNTMQVYSQPDSLRAVLDYYSSDYYTIAQYTNHTSNNVYAESIFKYLGHARFGKGSFANGSKAIGEFMSERNIERSGVRIVDGSGLSRLNRVTADFICRYLAAMSKEPCYNDFMQSLAEVGESGTAKSMLPDLPKDISIHLKTGSLDEVKAYAGYITTAKGDTLAFAIISNGYECSSKAASDRLNKILLKIATTY